MCVFVFRQKTSYEMRISDWSSDVCASDLQPQRLARQARGVETGGNGNDEVGRGHGSILAGGAIPGPPCSCRSGFSRPYKGGAGRVSCVSGSASGSAWMPASGSGGSASGVAEPVASATAMPTRKDRGEGKER